LWRAFVKRRGDSSAGRDNILRGSGKRHWVRTEADLKKHAKKIEFRFGEFTLSKLGKGKRSRDWRQEKKGSLTCFWALTKKW